MFYDGETLIENDRLRFVLNISFVFILVIVIITFVLHYFHFFFRFIILFFRFFFLIIYVLIVNSFLHTLRLTYQRSSAFLSISI